MLEYILIILLFIVITIYILSFNRKVKYYDYGKRDSKVKICLIGGVHGNERAGPIILQELVDNKYFESIKKEIFIRVIPCVNEFGFKFNTRYQNNIFHPDINRNYVNNGLCRISRQIIELTREMNLVVDFHEGWGFHRFQPSSLGSTLTVTKNITDLGKKIIDNINKGIKEDKYKFMLLYDICDIKTTLACYLSNKKFILVETSGQNDIQPIGVRTEQIKVVIDTIMEGF